MDVYLLTASILKSDGGSLFGNLPRPLWKKFLPPDRQNRVQLACNALLIVLPDHVVLVDTGCGNPEWLTADIRRRHSLGRNWPLLDQMLRLGLSPEDVDTVILTHLHWDHAGGAFDPSGNAAFPRARYFVSRSEYEAALSNDPVYYRAYPRAVQQGLRKLPQRRLKIWNSNHCTPLSGIRLVLTAGHSVGHCTVELNGDIRLRNPAGNQVASNHSLLFTGDEVPTSYHLHPAYNMAFDVYPLAVRRWKLKRLPAAAAACEIVVFSHDPTCSATRLQLSLRSSTNFPMTVAGPPLVSSGKNRQE